MQWIIDNLYNVNVLLFVRFLSAAPFTAAFELDSLKMNEFFFPRKLVKWTEK